VRRAPGEEQDRSRTLRSNDCGMPLSLEKVDRQGMEQNQADEKRNELRVEMRHERRRRQDWGAGCRDT